jgi:hypothetical protein
MYIVTVVETARAERLEQSDDAPSLRVKSNFPESYATMSREIIFG